METRSIWRKKIFLSKQCKSFAYNVLRKILKACVYKVAQSEVTQLSSKFYLCIFLVNDIHMNVNVSMSKANCELHTEIDMSMIKETMQGNHIWFSYRFVLKSISGNRSTNHFFLILNFAFEQGPLRAVNKYCKMWILMCNTALVICHHNCYC